MHILGRAEIERFFAELQFCAVHEPGAPTLSLLSRLNEIDDGRRGLAIIERGPGILAQEGLCLLAQEDLDSPRHVIITVWPAAVHGADYFVAYLMPKARSPWPPAPAWMEQSDGWARS